MFEQRSPWSCSSQKISMYIWLIRPDFSTNLDRSSGQQSRLWSRNDTSSYKFYFEKGQGVHEATQHKHVRRVSKCVSNPPSPGNYIERRLSRDPKQTAQQKQAKADTTPSHNTPTKAPRNKQKQEHSGHQPEDRRTAKANQPHKDQTDGTTARLVVVLP